MNLAVLLVALAFFGMGLVALIKPRKIGNYFELRLDSVDSRNEVRAVYGGFGLAMAAVLLLAMRAPELRAGLLTAVSLALAGMALGRVISAVVERPGRWPAIFGVIETLGASLLWWARGG